MPLEEAYSNSLFTETRVYTTRRKSDATQSQNAREQPRISARRVRSSSRKDASRDQNLMLPSINSTRSSRRLGTNALPESLRRSKRITKSSDDSEGHDVSSSAFVSNDSIEENDSEVMTVDSDTPSFNDGSSVDSDCKLVGEELFIENNEGAIELIDRLDFQTNAAITKRKRKPSRKRHRNDTVQVAKPDEVTSEAEILKSGCSSPCNNEKVVNRCGKEDGDEHLPLVKRARVRMGRQSPAGDEEGMSVQEEEKGLEAPDEPLNSKVDASSDGDSVPIKGDPGSSSLLHASPARKPQYWEARKDFVDGEAALPPSKRLHRALEAMSANAAEDSQRASSCSPTANTNNNGRCSSSFQLSMVEKAVVELGPGLVDNPINGDSQSSAPEVCMGLNKEVTDTDGKTFKVGSDRGKPCVIDSSISESCKASFERVEGAGSEQLKLSPSSERPAEPDAEYQHVNLESANVDGELSHLDCDRPSSIMSPDGCGIEPSDMKEVPRRPDPDVLKSGSILVEEIAGGSAKILEGISLDSAEGGGDESHKTKHVYFAKYQDCQRSELRSASMDSNAVPSATHVNDLTSNRSGYLCHSNSSSDNQLEDRVVSVTQSSSTVSDGPDTITKASPSSSSIRKFSASDNNSNAEKKSSPGPDVQLHHEKSKSACNPSSNVESLSSFETSIRSLTRAKESIGRATRIAIDCAKCGFATKVVEILTRTLESESSPHKKVDLFFLVDSIAQCSGGIKGDAGIYPSAIQAVLPRLLLAAAPPGASFYENHRQCLKVLRVWLERKILPEPIIRHQIRDLDALYGLHHSGGSRRSCRFERPFDDPIREMEGMLVDEYGSNSSIQLPGFCMPPMLRDDDIGTDSDGEGFEAVTPEHNVENLDGETALTSAVAKRSHILEDVDGELEMEDVAPSCEIHTTSTNNSAGTGCVQMSHHRSDNNYGTPFAPQQPKDTQPMSAPMPSSPLSSPPAHIQSHRLPPSVFPSAVLDSVSNGPDSKPCPSSQDLRAKQSLSPRFKPRTFDPERHRAHDNENSETHLPRQMPGCSNAHPFCDQLTSRQTGRASNGFQSVDGPFSKGFHLRPPHPAPSNQFSYVQERSQSRRDIPPPSNRFHSRNAENGNFYRDRDRNKYVPHDNIGEYWRPPLPSVSGPGYHDGPRMARAPMYSGPHHEPALPNNRWNFPPRYMNQRQYHPYRPPLEGPIPVAGRGTNFWEPR
ncbi:hypothetical protein CDL12_24423 [Handroanthus impetiginosus]|uniref:CID domain-containing protein n=1 Tax=Handroanthus impetiginosus TaxID=429701 RepID=A0A2G9GCQ0_9LAMI|nr:hypothetical protein CDL12_24423 [Handroanthus impetiginosus]